MYVRSRFSVAAATGAGSLALAAALLFPSNSSSQPRPAHVEVARRSTLFPTEQSSEFGEMLQQNAHAAMERVELTDARMLAPFDLWWGVE